MNNFWTRLISGAIFTGTLVFSAIFNKYLTALLFALFTVLGTLEYFKIVRNKNVYIHRGTSLTLSLSCYSAIVLSHFFDLPFNPILIIIPLVSLMLIFEVFRMKEFGFNNIAHGLFPSLYIAVPFGLFMASNELLQIDETSYSAHYTLFFFFTLWSNDTGAYLAGRAFGKTKLFPAISPNKTWEGTIGGAVAAILIANLCGYYYEEFNQIIWTAIALMIVVFGSLGDLLESLLKRNFGVKDSGRIMPGHGGLLDRFDSLLLAAPLIYCFLLILDQIKSL